MYEVKAQVREKESVAKFGHGDLPFGRIRSWKFTLRLAGALSQAIHFLNAHKLPVHFHVLLIRTNHKLILESFQTSTKALSRRVLSFRDQCSFILYAHYFSFLS